MSTINKFTVLLILCIYIIDLERAVLLTHRMALSKSVHLYSSYLLYRGSWYKARGFTLFFNVWTTMSWTCTKIFSILGGGQFFWRHWYRLTWCFIFSNLCRALCTKFITWAIWIVILILVHRPRVTVKCSTFQFLLVCHTCLQLHNKNSWIIQFNCYKKNQKTKGLS